MGPDSRGELQSRIDGLAVELSIAKIELTQACSNVRTLIKCLRPNHGDHGHYNKIFELLGASVTLQQQIVQELTAIGVLQRASKDSGHSETINISESSSKYSYVTPSYTTNGSVNSGLTSHYISDSGITSGSDDKKGGRITTRQNTCKEEHLLDLNVSEEEFHAVKATNPTLVANSTRFADGKDLELWRPRDHNVQHENEANSLPLLRSGQHNRLFGMATYIEDMNKVKEKQYWTSLAREWGISALKLQRYYRTMIRPKFEAITLTRPNSSQAGIANLVVPDQQVSAWPEAEQDLITFEPFPIKDDDAKHCQSSDVHESLCSNAVSEEICMNDADATTVERLHKKIELSTEQSSRWVRRSPYVCFDLTPGAGRNSIIITGVPASSTLSDVMERVRGARVTSSYWCETKDMRTIPLMAGNSAFVTFADQAAAFSYAEFYEKNPLYLYDQENQRQVQVNVSLIATPTLLPSTKGSSGCHGYR